MTRILVARSSITFSIDAPVLAASVRAISASDEASESLFPKALRFDWTLRDWITFPWWWVMAQKAQPPQQPR